MKLEWTALIDRDRKMLSIALLCCFIYVLYWLLYLPMSRAVHEKSEQLQSQKSTLQWMRVAQKQHAAQGSKKNLTSSQLLTLVANQLKSSAFKRFSHRLLQTKVGDVQLIFDAVPFNSFVQWLSVLDARHSVSIKRLSVEHTAKPGIVRLDLVLGGT